MTAVPRVSMLMPARNGARWLTEAIDSVLQQSLQSLELIVIDDGSTDATPGILASYAARDNRVNVIAQPALGLVSALNRGLAHARGELIARLDADDSATPERLARQLAIMDSRPQLVLLGTWAEKIDQDGAVGGLIKPPSDPRKLAQSLTLGNPFIHSSVMFRTAVARDLGGYRAAFEAAEDYDLWLRMADRGDIAIAAEPLVRYRVHPENVTSRKAVRQLFSTRLAQRTAASRRETCIDPAIALTAPPDWWADDAVADFFAADARLARVLELADRDFAQTADLAKIDLGILAADPLARRERKLAQAAILNLLRRRGRPDAMSATALLWRLLALHPPHAVSLYLGQRTGRDLK